MVVYGNADFLLSIQKALNYMYDDYEATCASRSFAILIY